MAINFDTPTKAMYDQLRKSKDAVDDGYGEYIVFRKGAAPSPISEKTYVQARVIINQCNWNHTVRGNKTQLIRNQIQKIDETLDVCFIPRQLFDLTVLHASIEEDLERRRTCTLPDSDPACYTYFLKGLSNPDDEDHCQYSKSKLESCFHICKFPNEKFAESDELLNHLSYRVNQLLLQKFQPKGAFTGVEITQMVEKETQFFIVYHTKYYSKKFSEVEVDFEINANQSPTLSFGVQSRDIKQMGIADQNAAQFIYNAIALECSPQAVNSYILYRAGDVVRDKNNDPENIRSTSLSYSTSLFSGAVYDPTATTFHYTIAYQRDTYAIIIPYHQYPDSPYYYPQEGCTQQPICALGQLYCLSEFWHGRTKFPKDHEGARGIEGVEVMSKSKEPPVFLISPLNHEAYCQQLDQFQSKLWKLTA